MSASAAIASSASTGIANLCASVVPVPPIATSGFWEWASANPVVTAAMVAGGVALMVGLLTFTGVVLSLRHSRKESRRDREHSADEANKERLATMRREVYLDAVSELVKVQTYIGGLAKQDIAQKNIIHGLEGFQIAASKVAVVAEQATALKIRELSSRYGLLALSSMKILILITKARTEAQQFGQLYQASTDAVDSVLKEMDQLSKSGRYEPEKFGLLKKSFDMHSKFASERMADRDNANKAMIKGEFEYADSVRGEIISLVIELDDLACAIRRELNIATDREAFRTQSKDIQIKIMLAVDDVKKLSQIKDDNPA